MDLRTTCRWVRRQLLRPAPPTGESLPPQGPVEHLRHHLPSSLGREQDAGRPGTGDRSPQRGRGPEQPVVHGNDRAWGPRRPRKPHGPGPIRFQNTTTRWVRNIWVRPCPGAHGVWSVIKSRYCTNLATRLAYWSEYREDPVVNTPQRGTLREEESMIAAFRACFDAFGPFTGSGIRK